MIDSPRDDLTSRFLDAFSGIEDWMRSQLNVPKNGDFADLLVSLAKVDSNVRRHASILKRFARLRALIAHPYSLIQSPTLPKTRWVEQIINIRDQLLSPTLLLSVATSPVETCRPTDPFGWSAKKMHDGIFSQLPVYDGDNFVGLLTAETIVRWLASNLGDGMIEKRPILAVLQYQADPDNHTFCSRTSTVADGLEAFETFLNRGKRLEAILITQNGRSTERPIGIVTTHDIPKMRKAIQE